MSSRTLFLLSIAPLLLVAAPLAACAGMSQAEMGQMVRQRYATRPESPQAVLPADAVVDTIITGAYGLTEFDADHSPDTFVDTLTIYQGGVVLWKWYSAVHTTTSGTPDDPMPGTLWDHSITSSTPEFAYTFNDVGDFPFFCAIDQGQMRGLIKVVPAVSALPASKHIGFVANPFPNPSTGAVSFRIGLRDAGQARAQVFDARGRLMATLLDGFAPAGSQLVSWDGKMQSGTPAHSGIYFVSLRVPGYTGRRSFVLDR